MKIKTLLAQAAKCKTQEDADHLLVSLEKAFGEHKLFALLTHNNGDANMEGDKPFVSFEMNREISGYYITMIKPEIRDEKLVVVVVTNYMDDGNGISSQSWEVADGLREEVIEAEPEQTVAQIAKLAVEFAISDHQEIIERVGVSSKDAARVAKKSW